MTVLLLCGLWWLLVRHVYVGLSLDETWRDCFSVVTNMTSAAATFVTNGGSKIWHRPTPGGSNGSSHAVLSANVPDKVSTLLLSGLT